MIEILCSKERIIVGEDLKITFTITDAFNRLNYKGKYVYLHARKYGTNFIFLTNIQLYNSENIEWIINKNDYETIGTFVVEAKVSVICTQSLTNQIVACNTFIVEPTLKQYKAQTDNITAMKNLEQNKTKRLTDENVYKLGVSQDSKVTTNIKPYTTNNVQDLTPKQKSYNGILQATYNVNSKL